MKDETDKMVEGLRSVVGDDAVTVMHSHQLDSETIDNAGMVILTMDAGSRQQAEDMALAANEAATRNPKIIFMFSINGCDDDPREVDEIPEARLTLRVLREGLSQASFWRFQIEHQCLMMVAMNAGHRVGTTLHVPPWLVRDPAL